MPGVWFRAPSVRCALPSLHASIVPCVSGHKGRAACDVALHWCQVQRHIQLCLCVLSLSLGANICRVGVCTAWPASCSPLGKLQQSSLLHDYVCVLAR